MRKLVAAKLVQIITYKFKWAQLSLKNSPRFLLSHTLIKNYWHIKVLTIGLRRLRRPKWVGGGGGGRWQLWSLLSTLSSFSLFFLFLQIFRILLRKTLPLDRSDKAWLSYFLQTLPIISWSQSLPLYLVKRTQHNVLHATSLWWVPLPIHQYWSGCGPNNPPIVISPLLLQKNLSRTRMGIGNNNNIGVKAAFLGRAAAPRDLLNPRTRMGRKWHLIGVGVKA